MSGRHPAIDFDAALHIGQVVEARFTNNNRALRFRAEVVKLNERTARVKSLVEGVNGWPAGHVFVIDRFSSPQWSENNGLYPVGDRNRTEYVEGLNAVVQAVTAQPDLLSQIMDYESGEMSDEETIAFFQGLIDSGLAWQLQGHYGRTATRFIESGQCSSKEK